MKYYIILLACLLPVSTLAASKLADCDNVPYDIIVRNSGAERIVTLTPTSGEIEEYGPVISFQIKDKDESKTHPVVTVLDPDSEFCIWHGKINIQRIDTTNNNSAY